MSRKNRNRNRYPGPGGGRNSQRDYWSRVCTPRFVMQCLNALAGNLVSGNASVKAMQDDLLQKQVDLGEIYGTTVFDPELPDSYNQVAMLNMMARGLPKEDLADGLRIINSGSGTGANPVDTQADLAALGSTGNTYEDCVRRYFQAIKAKDWDAAREWKAKAQAALKEKSAARAGASAAGSTADATTVLNSVGNIAQGAGAVVTSLASLFGE